MYYIVVSDPGGNVGEDKKFEALGRIGFEIYEPLKDPVELPEGSQLHFLPGRAPRGRNIRSGKTELLRGEDLAVSAVLPPGFVRSHLPAYHKEKGAPDLPFFAFTALGLIGDTFRAAAILLEDDYRWSPYQYDSRDLPIKIKRKLKDLPGNRLIRHLARCAGEYHCYTAQNIFYSRWEGGLPVSPGCNAKCYGCLSAQEEPRPVSPQDRIAFQPTVEEIVQAAVPHLQAEGAIVSFGQGCEGEPTLSGDLLLRAVAEIRRATSRGTININTNGSKPEVVSALFDAGLDSIRVSLSSAIDEDYAAYYRPMGYSFSDVRMTLETASSKGKFLSLNLLTFPGYTDREDQVSALVDLMKTFEVGKLQVRNLNGDPDILYSILPRDRTGNAKILGIAGMIDYVRARMPRLAIGCFSPPLR